MLCFIRVLTSSESEPEPEPDSESLSDFAFFDFSDEAEPFDLSELFDLDLLAPNDGILETSKQKGQTLNLIFKKTSKVPSC